VAVVVGAAFGTVVKALVADFITPLIAAIGGKPNFQDLFFTVHKSKFMYGDFLNNLISFLIVAAVVYYFVVMPVGKLLERFKPTPDLPAVTKDCPHCLSKIPVAAVVCAFCTRDVETAEPAAAELI
jgi:large conductance mechanosensitive channel